MLAHGVVSKGSCTGWLPSSLPTSSVFSLFPSPSYPARVVLQEREANALMPHKVVTLDREMQWGCWLQMRSGLRHLQSRSLDEAPFSGTVPFPALTISSEGPLVIRVAHDPCSTVTIPAGAGSRPWRSRIDVSKHFQQPHLVVEGLPVPTTKRGLQDLP